MKRLIASHENIINGLRKEKIILQNASDMAIKSNKKEIEELENKRKIFKNSSKSKINGLSQEIIKIEKENITLVCLCDSLKQEIDDLHKEKNLKNTEVNNLRINIKNLRKDRKQSHIALTLIGNEIRGKWNKCEEFSCFFSGNPENLTSSAIIYSSIRQHLPPQYRY